MEIDIKGLDRAELLAALYNRAHRQGMEWHGRTGAITRQQAQEIIDAREAAGLRLYFDYLMGRCIKLDIGGDTLDPRLHDRDLGEGATLRAVLVVRTRSEEI